MSKILRSLGFSLGLETFANFWRVSVLVSENLVSGKKSRFWFRKIWSQKKIMGFGYREFGLEKRISFGKFGIEKKKFRFRKIWYRKKSLGIGFGQNFGIIIQCTAVARIFEFYLRSHNCLHLISLFKCESESESGARIGRCLKRLQDFSSKTSFHEPTTCLFSSFWPVSYTHLTLPTILLV